MPEWFYILAAVPVFALLQMIWFRAFTRTELRRMLPVAPPQTPLATTRPRLRIVWSAPVH
ncbi:MAG: hypothetical protein ACR2IF_00430 [Terriglobales bacterium]